MKIFRSELRLLLSLTVRYMVFNRWLVQMCPEIGQVPTRYANIVWYNSNLNYYTDHNNDKSIVNKKSKYDMLKINK